MFGQTGKYFPRPKDSIALPTKLTCKLMKYIGIS